MRAITVFLLLLLANSIYAKENCKKVAKATFYQGVIVSSLSDIDDAGIEKWRLLYGLSVDEYKRSRVSEQRQEAIAQQIVNAKLTSNGDVNAFLISDFFYAHCQVPAEQRAYEKISEPALIDLLSCWNDPEMKKEKKRRKCFVEKMKTP